MRGERRPGHAGPLATWERIAILVILAIMAALIILLTIAAGPVRQQHTGPAGRPAGVH
jgi:hypothetical protein